MTTSSFYWDQMLINKNSIYTNDFIISQEPPNFFSKKILYKLDKNICIHSLHDKNINLTHILKKLSNFYKKNNKLKTGNTILLEPNDILKYIDLNAELVILTKNKKILGSMLSVHIPIKINFNIKINDIVEKSEKYKKILPDNSDGKNIIFGCTTFLNNDKRYRGKGLGMVMIQKSLQIAYEEGVLTAYFLNRVKRCKNSVPIRNWYFPINLIKCDKCGIGYDKKYRGYYKLKYNPKYNIVKVTHKNLKLSLNAYLELVKNKKFYMIPDLNYWRIWITLFNTYIIKKNDEIISVFTINYFNNLLPNKNRLKYGQIMLYVTNSNYSVDNIKILLYTAKVENYDIMHLQEIGDITNFILKKISAVDSKLYDYLNFYNSTIQLKNTDLYIPLI